jgi:hypothetical protein
MKRLYRKKLCNLALALCWAHVHGQQDVVASLLESMTKYERWQVCSLIAQLHQALQEDQP